MRLEIDKTVNGTEEYFIYLKDANNEENMIFFIPHIVEYLNLTIEDYFLFQINHQAYKNDNEHFYFKNKKDAEKCIEELEPYLVMAELVK